MKNLLVCLCLLTFCIVSCTNDLGDNVEGDRTDLEKAVVDYIDDISSFKTDIDAWRTSPQGASIDAVDAVGKTEAVFNFYLGRPKAAYESYSHGTKRIFVAPTAHWSPSEVIDFYEQVKQALAKDLVSPEHQLVMLSLSDPIPSQKGQAVVKMQYHIGFKQVGADDVAQELNDDEADAVRWTREIVLDGQTITCSGDAADLVASLANQQIGFYQPINRGPGSDDFSGDGNTLDPESNVIVSRIVYGSFSPYGTDVRDWYAELGASDPSIQNVYA